MTSTSYKISLVFQAIFFLAALLGVFIIFNALAERPVTTSARVILLIFGIPLFTTAIIYFLIGFKAFAIINDKSLEYKIYFASGRVELCDIKVVNFDARGMVIELLDGSRHVLPALLKNMSDLARESQTRAYNIRATKEYERLHRDE